MTFEGASFVSMGGGRNKPTPKVKGKVRKPTQDWLAQASVMSADYQQYQ